MKLLILSRYSRKGASSRLRTMQYIPALSKSGFEVEVDSFFDDEYLTRLYAGKKTNSGMLTYFFNRLRRTLSQNKPDLIWIEKEAFPWLPWFIERLLLPSKIPIISDYDDAVFHRYDQHKRTAIRTILGNKIDNVMGASSLVTAGNQYLAQRAYAAGAKLVKIVPTVVDTRVYNADRRRPLDDRSRIGWIGTPGTWKDYCVPMMPMLSNLARQHDVMIRAIGARNVGLQDPTLEILPWSEETEISLIQTMDIGIMPLDDSSWSQGKCGYKLIQYMACGLPVVASPVGVNSEIVEHGVNGFLATTEKEWQNHLNHLLSDPQLAARMGAEGRRRVEERYSLHAWEPRVVRMMQSSLSAVC